MTDVGVAKRPQPRRERTRRALIAAAQRLIADGTVNVPIATITTSAGIGLGSFYNHFDSKESLFDVAVSDALDMFGSMLDARAPTGNDAVETFARSFRLTGRLHRRHPELSRIILKSGADVVSAEKGLAPRVRRDLAAGIEAGRFRASDPDLSMALVCGAALGLGQLLHRRPDIDDAEATDETTVRVLQLLGIDEPEALRICDLPIPRLEPLIWRPA